MQTRTYGDLFSLISNMIGAVTLASDEQTQVKNFINRRFQEAFDTSPVWPRYVVSSEERQIIALTLSGATSSTSTSVNQNYKLLGSNTTGGTNVYQGVTTNTVIIYNTGSAWRVDTSASAAEQADGTYTVSAGTQQFIEADTNKKDNVEDVETWTPRSGSDVLSVVAKQLIPYAETNKTTIGDFNRIHRKALSFIWMTKYMFINRRCDSRCRSWEPLMLLIKGFLVVYRKSSSVSIGCNTK